MPNESLHQVDTHAAGDDSEGVVWGIRFELLGICLGGVGIGVVLMGLLLWTQHSTLQSVLAGAIPAVLALGYVAFRQTHPPGYDSDLVDLGVSGRGFGPCPDPAEAGVSADQDPA